MLHAVILAGGAGTRLWPSSRFAAPKHLLVFESQQTLLEGTLQRLNGLVPPERTWIVTSRRQSEMIASALPTFDRSHILSEPVAKNTAASIGWAAVKLQNIDSDATMLVLPADHLIKPASVFCTIIQQAVEHVECFPQTLATVGIKPTFPAASYGYIQRGERKQSAYTVQRFCEKPDRETAETFFQSGEFYWNGGIFVWKAERMIELLRRFEPDIGQALAEISEALGTSEEDAVTESAFQRMNSISIDYAVMERAENVVVWEADFDWNDVGTWTALDRIHAEWKDAQGNIAVDTPVLAIDSSGCTVRCDNPAHLIALIGMQNVVVIQTADATLIAKKEQEESVRRIAEELKKQNKEQWR